MLLEIEFLKTLYMLLGLGGLLITFSFFNEAIEETKKLTLKEQFARFLTLSSVVFIMAYSMQTFLNFEYYG